MGKGYEENQARLQSLSLFGKDLARRAKSTCELSQQSGVPLRIYEVPPVKDPDYDRCLFLSDEVIATLEKPANLIPDQWRHLGELIWSDIPMVQLMSVRILTFLAQKKDATWAQDIIEEAYLNDETLAAAAEAPL